MKNTASRLVSEQLNIDVAPAAVVYVDQIGIERLNEVSMHMTNGSNMMPRVDVLTLFGSKVLLSQIKFEKEEDLTISRIYVSKRSSKMGRPRGHTKDPD